MILFATRPDHIAVANKAAVAGLRSEGVFTCGTGMNAISPLAARHLR